MEFYHRLGGALSTDELGEIKKEMKDRFGKLPLEALWLYHLNRVRVFAALRGFSEIVVGPISIRAEKNRMIHKALIGKISSPHAFEEKIVDALKRINA